MTRLEFLRLCEESDKVQIRIRNALEKEPLDTKLLLALRAEAVALKEKFESLP